MTLLPAPVRKPASQQAADIDLLELQVLPPPLACLAVLRVHVSLLPAVVNNEQAGRGAARSQRLESLGDAGGAHHGIKTAAAARAIRD
jgi:hypothetical protein